MPVFCDLGLSGNHPTFSILLWGSWRQLQCWRCSIKIGSRQLMDRVLTAFLPLYWSPTARKSGWLWSLSRRHSTWLGLLHSLWGSAPANDWHNGVKWGEKLYEPSPVPILYVGRVEDLLGRVPFIPCFPDGNVTSTIPNKYARRQKSVFECGCADGSGPAPRRGSHVYEINTWLCAFGRPQPRIGGLSVAKTQLMRKASRSEASKRGWETKRAQKCSAAAPWRVYTWYLPGIICKKQAFRINTDIFLSLGCSLYVFTCVDVYSFIWDLVGASCTLN